MMKEKFIRFEIKSGYHRENEGWVGMFRGRYDLPSDFAWVEEIIGEVGKSHRPPSYDGDFKDGSGFFAFRKDRVESWITIQRLMDVAEEFPSWLRMIEFTEDDIEDIKFQDMVQVAVTLKEYGLNTNQLYEEAHS
jgi:hypothetical protein